MTRKLHNPKNDATSIHIPCWLIQIPSKQLSHQAKLLYGRLSMWSNAHGNVFRSIIQLSKELGCSKSTIDRTIKELKLVNLIGTFQPYKGGINHFEFYDHPWMHESIKEQLSYKRDNMYMTSNVTSPCIKSDINHASNVTHINIKEIINNNNINNIPVFGEYYNLPYTELSQIEDNKKSDYFDNQENTKNKQILSLQAEDKATKSDYCENQLKNKTERKKSNQYTLENILNNNPFQIPIEMIQDYQINRKNKRAPITATSWNMINKQLAKCKERNIEPQEAFETMVARGWQSMNVEWVTPNSNKNNSCGDSLSRVMSKYNTQHGGVYDQHGNSFDPLR